MTRDTFTRRALAAGCTRCHGQEPRWTGPNAQGLAARHHDITGHATWCDVSLEIRYGRDAPDDRQTDIEDAIRGAAA